MPNIPMNPLAASRCSAAAGYRERSTHKRGNCVGQRRQRYREMASR